MQIDWQQTHAAIWRSRQGNLRPVTAIDPISLPDLLGVERQKNALCANTERFIAAQPCNHALLWGARGTGKSSLIKAVFNQYRDRDLRLVEISKNDLLDLPELAGQIRDLPYRFIVYCDDLSFEANDSSYVGLKSILEGTIEQPPQNVLLYVTSNRRHLVPENMEDNLGTQVVQTELHYTDAVEEKISLSDRFGLWLSFYQPDQVGYLQMVDHYFRGYTGDREVLHKAAIRFARSRASTSGRTAWQFFRHHGEIHED